MDDRTRELELLDDDFDLFDDEPADDRSEPERSPQRKRFSARRPRSAPNWSRIGTAIAVGLVVIFTFGMIVKACAESRRNSAYENYFAQVDELLQNSDRQGKELDSVLDSPTGAERAQITVKIEELANDAGELTRQAQEIETPESLRDDTHEWLIATLTYRQNGLTNLKRALAQALGSSDDPATTSKVAAEAMQRLLASDVIYRDSFAATAKDQLAADDVKEVEVPESTFVENLEFGSPQNMELVIQRLQSDTPAGKKKQSGPVKGVHGLGLSTVVAQPSGLELAGGLANEIQASADLAFEVLVENQGEGQETQVPVEIELKGTQSEPLKLTATLDTIDPGAKVPVTVPVTQTPTLGETLTMTVKIGTVPGEKIDSNNSAAYTVQFRT